MMNQFSVVTLVVILSVALMKSDFGLGRAKRSNSRTSLQQGCIRNRHIDSSNIPESSPIVYYQTSPQNGRTKYAEACIGKEHLKTGRPTNSDSREYKKEMGGQPHHDAGYVIGNQLDGNVDERNLFPQVRNINRGALRSVENKVAEIVRQENGYVWFQVKLHYTDASSTIPDKILYEATRLPNNDLLEGDWEHIASGEFLNQ